MTANGAMYRLGLDLGTNSIGWAAVRLDEKGESRGLLDMGVRIFPDGRTPQRKESNAVERRLARGQRRRRDRYLQRRGKLMDCLVEFGLMPACEDDRRRLNDMDPYRLRAQALDDRLEPHQLGRALFHLGQRRGFKSNRKMQGDDESDASETREAISELRRQIKASGARTLGEFQAHRQEQGQPLRARQGVGLYPERAMYEAEFDELRKAQQPHHRLTDDQWDVLKEIIFFQRPLKPVDPGWCLLEEGEKRAAKALPISQEIRMLQEVNNLRVRVGTEPERPLDGRERERAMKRLREGKDIALGKGRDNTPAKPTRDLGLPSDAVFNLAAGGRKSIKGDETAGRLMKSKRSKTEPERMLFGNRWLEMPLDERNNIVSFLLQAETSEDVHRKATEDWRLDQKQAEALANVPLASGYGNLSEKAMAKLLPHLLRGRVYSDAVLDAGYPSHSDFRNDEAHDRLPYYGVVLPRAVVGANPAKDPRIDGEPARHGRLANPTVHIGLNQLRRVVNGLIDAYGKPEEIVVEVARDLKMGREAKANLNRQQRGNEKRNDRRREMLESMGVQVTPGTMRKLRLWEQQGTPQARVCPYTGRQISCRMAVSSETEVDHILPFSRTLDNAESNMVVCIAGANRDKGDRSPYEAFGHSPAGYDYEGIVSRVANWPRNKRWRFDKDAMERYEGERGFLDRQLNEASYLSRTARAYLAYLYDEKSDGRVRVRAVPGRMTALLRRGWGLEGILRVTSEGVVIRGKQRDDHRHHAIDAFVVANTTQGLLQRFASASASRGGVAEDRLAAVVGEVMPWDGFNRNQLRSCLDRLVVSYKSDHGAVGRGTTGQLHNETAYGLIEVSEDGTSKVVTRKMLSDLKRRSDLDCVRDPVLRTALIELWDGTDAKNDTERAAVFAERAWVKGVVVGDKYQQVRRVRITDEQRVIPIKDHAGKPYKGYLPGGNEFADVWKMRDGSWQLVVVPRFHANQPDFDIEEFRPKTSRGKHKGKPDPTAERLMRIRIDDMGALGEGLSLRIVRVRKITNPSNNSPSVVLDDHNEANVAQRVARKELREGKYYARKLQEAGFRVVKVDAIGRLNDPGAFLP